MRAILLPAILMSAYFAVAPADAREHTVPHAIHCMSGPFIVFAAHNASALDANATRILDLVIEIATTGSCSTSERLILSVYGHRDRDETAAISLARALAARDYLLAKGFPKTRIEIADAGDTTPRRDNKLDAPEHENRRTELLFRYAREDPARDTRRP